MKFYEYIFSIKNKNCHKVITFLGIQLKIYSIKLHIKQLSEELAPIIKYSRFVKRQINKDLTDVQIRHFKREGAMGINQNKPRAPKLIVSLTSFPERVPELHYAIYSLLTQSIKPDKVILWLAEGQFPYRDEDLTQDVLDFKKHGLTIEYIPQDIKAYKKFVPAMQRYPEDIIVTADDDLFYPPTWLEQLYSEYLENPDCIYAHRVFKSKLNLNSTLAPFEKWKARIDDESASILNHGTTGGGVLFPPHSLYKDALNEELFTRLSPLCDESWAWAMAVLQHTKTKVVKDPQRYITFVNAFKSSRFGTETALGAENIDQNYKDVQLSNITRAYPDLIKILREENKKLKFRKGEA